MRYGARAGTAASVMKGGREGFRNSRKPAPEWWLAMLQRQNRAGQDGRTGAVAAVMEAGALGDEKGWGWRVKWHSYESSAGAVEASLGGREAAGVCSWVMETAASTNGAYKSCDTRASAVVMAMCARSTCSWFGEVEGGCGGRGGTGWVAAAAGGGLWRRMEAVEGGSLRMNERS